MDPRPLREIYLRGFPRGPGAQPWTVMCSSNRISGVHASEDPWLLSRLLRDELGFEGLVVSDGGAVNDRVAGLAAGLDLEMPSSGGTTDAEIVGGRRRERQSREATRSPSALTTEPCTGRFPGSAFFTRRSLRVPRRAAPQSPARSG
ncbi:hypothetical protein E6C70_12455 [Glaciibacter flavus]|uniref:Glycoside hydrolase family 3 N-terminal domain-containing protein n=1 Tax=Orlajensenia flava TaxID=2565934 RepID=A0A4S4FQ60_9MICO|nr:hypothetical protein E6C70_12455 [Glaciibacter flavus]